MAKPLLTDAERLAMLAHLIEIKGLTVPQLGMYLRLIAKL